MQMNESFLGGETESMFPLECLDSLLGASTATSSRSAQMSDVVTSDSKNGPNTGKKTYDS